MDLHVLSSHAGRSSAYLLRHGGTTVLVDCGPGAAVALDRADLLGHLDAVLITHEHADHAADLIGLAYARRFPDPLDQIPLYAPPSTLDTLLKLDDLFAVPTLPAMGHTIRSAFEPHALPLDGRNQHLGTLSVASFPARHAVQSAALRFTLDDQTITFSSDTTRCDGLLEAAHAATLLLCEATYLDAPADELVNHGHLTPRQAGEIAAETNAATLALTHLSRPEQAPQALAAAASNYPPERTIIASAGRRINHETIAREASSTSVP